MKGQLSKNGVRAVSKFKRGLGKKDGGGVFGLRNC